MIRIKGNISVLDRTVRTKGIKMRKLGKPETRGKLFGVNGNVGLTSSFLLKSRHCMAVERKEVGVVSVCVYVC